jgi:hypothetical protein
LTAKSGVIKVYFESDDWQRGAGFTARWGIVPAPGRENPDSVCGDGYRDNYFEE